MRGYFLKKTLLVALAAVAIATAIFLFRPSPAGAQAIKTYVLMANDWGVAQDAAVAVAGGTVTFSHGPTGIGVATSGEPGFLKRVLAGGAIARGAEDMMVQWQPPVREGDMIEAAVTPADETFINLQWNTTAVEAEAAWAAGYTGQGVRVAVIDGGIYDSHVDLVGRIDVGASRSFVPGFAFNQDANRDGTWNTFWHATHVAGIIAANDNGIGTIGIAPEATIIGVKALHGGSGSFSQVIQGILYASTPIAEGGAGADIINISLGALFPKGGGNTGAGQLVAIMNYAVNHACQHALVVSAAGNNGYDLDHLWSYTFTPAQSGSGIAVSATGPMGFAVGWPYGATNYRRVASYTNYGNSLVWLAAPGGDWMLPGEDLCAVTPVADVPCWVYDMVLSCCRGDEDSISTYTWGAGTSMATPAVAAVAALVKQRFPFFGVADLKTWLAKTADDEGKKGNDPYYGKGFVNARRAVTE